MGGSADEVVAAFLFFWDRKSPANSLMEKTMRTKRVLMKKQIVLKVNGSEVDLLIKPHWALIDVLRDEIGLTGTKKGCGKGECGACTVIVDGKAILSCLVLAIQAQGKEIFTIEGLSRDSRLDPLQEAFVKYGAIQCGFCTPGMIITSRVLLNKNPHPTEEEIKRALSGNLCRCTGYVKIIEAVRNASTAEGRK
jgi:carbon-monoxide dehydrogenase small subunit